jgi:hypothetical protein
MIEAWPKKSKTSRRLSILKITPFVRREPYEVEDLHQKYPHLSHQTVADAVKNHGPERKKVEAYLDGLGHKK